ncbi:MAG: hypothetical protein SWE60_05835 [Thermodesulfobacteriota bacterium]|nr:hypothetical protein [Thermodesulfobacteriota bacterium]
MSFILDEKLKERLNDYRFNERFDTKSDAIRSLLKDALDRYEQQKAKSKK